jgi:trans-2-enoyl-CoA reductase
VADNETLQDPRDKHEQPDQDGEQLPAPGSEESVTSAMDVKPDHGEESYQGSGRLSDRVAIITGGDSGIGRAVAIAYAREGADLVLSYLEGEDEDAQQTAQLVEKAGRRAILVPGDLTQEDACQQVIDRTVSEFGRVDILVNNAAYQMGSQEESPTSRPSSSTG